MTAIDIRRLSFSVGPRAILQDIDLTIEAGTITAVMGMSGSGKTTLLKCMSGLLRPTSGEVVICGEDIARMRENEIDRVRLRMGHVFQYAALFDSLPVFENVAFGLLQHRRANRRTAVAAVAARLEEVGMAGSEALMPSELSGGMQKRVGLARALAMEPEILFYDEPTSGLDPVIARTIDDLIAETRSRRAVTSVIVSHDLGSAFRIADRVVMVHAGRKVAEGTPTEIAASRQPDVAAFVRAGGVAKETT